LGRAAIFKLLHQNFGHLNIQKLIGSGLVKAKQEDVTVVAGGAERTETRVKPFETLIIRTTDGGL